MHAGSGETFSLGSSSVSRGGGHDRWPDRAFVGGGVRACSVGRSGRSFAGDERCHQDRPSPGRTDRDAESDGQSAAFDLVADSKDHICVPDPGLYGVRVAESP